ncbi:MAG: ABC transporter family substrate-binding protein [Actinomycetota bacterium]|nr:ABC transporter family substrate-binding protein [Actinomycetota bacterium]
MNLGKRSAALIASGISGVLVLSGCGGGDEGGGGGGEETEASGTVVFGESTDFPDNLFPIISSGNATSVANILIRILPGAFQLLPDFTVAHDPELLTEEPTLEDVDGKQTNVYSINPDAVWSDGTPITADDFAFTAKVQDTEFTEVCPDGGILGTTGYDQIESIEGSDDGKTVTVTYETPFADWQSLFTLLPAHIMDNEDDAALCETVTAGWAIDQGIPEGISGGPWQLNADGIDVASQVITLTPNQEYWGEKPKLASLVYQNIGNDPGAAVSAIQNDEVQMIYPQPQLDLVDQIAALEPNVVNNIVFGLSFEHLDMNTRNPHLADVNVRQAFGMAMDRAEVVDQTVAQFSGDAEVLNNRIFFNNQPQYQDTAPEQYNAPDVAGATALLEESGYVLGGDGIYEHPERGRLSLAISTTVNNPLRQQTIDVIIPQVAEAGIEITARPDPDIFSDATVPTSLEAGGFDIALFAWVGSPFRTATAPIYLSLEAQGGIQGQNYTHGGNPEVDALFEEFLQEPDPDASAELGNQIDALLWEDLYTIPLYQKPTFLAYSSALEGVEDNATQAGPLWNSEKWSLTS